MGERSRRYEVLLRIRRREEEARATALAAAILNRSVAEVQRMDLEDHQQQVLEHAAARAAARLDARDMRLHYAYERHLSRMAVAKDAEVAELSAVAAEKQGELEHAVKRRRIAERLKERQEEARRERIRRAEQQTIDEIATIRAARSFRRGSGKP